MYGVIHREVRDDGPVPCKKLYLLCSNIFLGKHMKRHQRPTIIWPRYPKYSANPKARRLTSFYQMRNWGTKRLNDLSETTWKLLSLGLMTSPPEHPFPSLTLQHQTPAEQAAPEPAFLRHHHRRAPSINAVSPTQILWHIIKVHKKNRAKWTASSLWPPHTCSTKEKLQLPSSSPRVSP